MGNSALTGMEWESTFLVYPVLVLTQISCERTTAGTSVRPTAIDTCPSIETGVIVVTLISVGSQSNVQSLWGIGSADETDIRETVGAMSC